ncbi:MAG: protein kinase [Sandaracinaceae bacterium]
MDPLIGLTLDDRVRLLSNLGEGAMGKVYRAERLDGSGLVAVKVLNEDCSEQPDLRERFEREARALFGLSHPHILDVQDFGVSPKGQPYLMMELLEGRSLDAMVDEEELSLEMALELGRQVLLGLAFAHSHGVLHRDLKTENIFVVRRPDGTMHAKLLDFGLVKFVDDERWGEGRKLTVAGSVMGSPAYMSPEQGTGGVMDARSDVYSAGVVLFELLTGRWPFEAESRVEMLKAHLLDAVPKLASARPGLEVQPALDALIEKAMAKEPEHRWTDAQAMLAALDAIPRPAAWLSSAPARTTSSSPAGSLPPPPMGAGASPNAFATPQPLQPMTSQEGLAVPAYGAPPMMPQPQAAPAMQPMMQQPPMPAPLAVPPPKAEAPASRGPLIALAVILVLCVLATIAMAVLFLFAL